MKLLTITIPCYNSQEYMHHAIESALTGGKDVEILIVDDGSSDDTLSIAKEYQKKYPDIIRAIHKENGGHGSAVNTGIANAAGLYFKVLDSDDWFDEASLKKVLHFIKYIASESIPLDMIISNYVYEKPSIRKRKVVNYKSAIPCNRFFTWDDVKHFKMTQNLLMHSIMYRTQLLKDCKLVLPEHTFYVDNIFAFVPLPYVKKMYYLNVDLYRYYIGRDDQSVNEAVMTRRIDQQIKITKILMNSHNLMEIPSKKLQSYMLQYLSMMMIVSSALLVNEGSPENLQKREELWNYLKNSNKQVYYLIIQRKLGFLLRFKTSFGKKIIIQGYHFFNLLYGFN
ncbi:glycosyltransferase family 2 protein [bacterium D16-51]|nr:glycosyltransferase family 2 protein [bacterium D16-59]RKI60411.1 glycosyltransferase family 2 protein [bacterium D16-51]